MITGIYKITNINTDKMYIGSSKDIEYRCINHFSMLKNDAHHSIHLQRSYNKHGIDAFKFEIVEICDEKELINRENYYMNKLLKSGEYISGVSDYFIKHSYNICPIANKGFTGKHLRSSILKQLSSKGISSTLKVDIHGKIIDKYDILKESSDSIDCIILSKKNKQALRNKDYGYISEEEYYIGYKPSIVTTWNKGLKTGKCSNRKTVYVYDLYGRFYKKFNSLKDASIDIGISVPNISKVLNIKDRARPGKPGIKRLYRFFEEPQNYNELLDFTDCDGPIQIYTLFDECIGTSTIEDISKKLNVSKYSILDTVKGRQNECKNYKLKIQ